MGMLEKVGWDSRGGMEGEDRILHPAQAVYVTIMNTYNKRREHIMTYTRQEEKLHGLTTW